MEEQEGYHPKTNVDFAGTAAFKRKWGEQAAAVQQKKFERPSWTRATGTEAEVPLEMPTIVIDPRVYLALGAIGGVGLVLLLQWMRR